METERTMEGKQMKWLEYYKGKTVLVTGHTGFKGSWLCVMLEMAGAKAVGYALPPEKDAVLFDCSGAAARMVSVEGDIRDRAHLQEVFHTYQPQVVFHLAAQPIVRESYKNPVYTYETNVMGTVNVLEAVRQCGSVRSFLNVTTDKVYKNNEWEWGYRETDELDGYDPYSNSKSCSELVTHSYEKSFLKDMDIAVSTARAGNVIGGGDFAADRIIPDCVRAVSGGKKIAVRNPHSTRPYQHVLEPLGAYLLIAEEQYQDSRKAGSYNVGPDDRSCLTTGELADLFCTAWGNGAAWENLCQGGPHEANFLKLDCSRIRNRLGWKPRWQVDEAVVNTAKWYQAWLAGQNMAEYTDCQIKEYFGI